MASDDAIERLVRAAPTLAAAARTVGVGRARSTPPAPAEELPGRLDPQYVDTTDRAVFERIIPQYELFDWNNRAALVDAVWSGAQEAAQTEAETAKLAGTDERQANDKAKEQSSALPADYGLELSEPSILSGATRRSLARLLVLMAIVALGVAITALVLDDATTDVGNMPTLCVVVAIVSIVGAVIIASGYGMVKFGAGSKKAEGSEAAGEDDAGK